MEDFLQKNIDNYKRQYNKIRRLNILVILIFLFIFMAMVINGFLSYLLQHPLYITLFFIIIFCLFLVYFSFFTIRIQQASQVIAQDYHKQNDVEGCLAFFQEIVTNTEHKKDRSFVILQYMNLCFMLGRYKDMEDIYYTYKKDVFSPLHLKTYEMNVLTYASTLLQPNDLYERLYAKRKTIKVKNSKNLPFKKQMFYNYEMLTQANYAYHHQEYEKALTCISTVKPTNMNERLALNQAYVKNYCRLSRMDDAVPYIKLIQQENDAYAIVHNLSYILENKEVELPRTSNQFVETYYNDLQIFKDRNKHRQKILRIILTIVILLLLFFMKDVHITSYKPYTSLYDTIQQMEDYEVINEYGTFDIGGEHVGLVQLKMVKEDSEDPLNEFMKIATYEIVEVVEEHKDIQSVTLNGNKVFTFDTQTYLSHPLKDKKHTYVVMEGKLEELMYDHQMIRDFTYDEIVGLMKDDVHTITCFLLETQDFDIEKLQYVVK